MHYQKEFRMKNGEKRKSEAFQEDRNLRATWRLFKMKYAWKELCVTLVIAALVFAGICEGQQSEPGKEKMESLTLKSASIEVTYMTFLGRMGGKKVSLNYAGSGYTIKYSCYSMGTGFKWIEREVEHENMEHFLEVIESFKDGGRKAKCCDHPWTEIELIYFDGSSKNIAVAFEPVRIEEIFNISCEK
jgi:hypothetical protein